MPDEKLPIALRYLKRHGWSDENLELTQFIVWNLLFVAFIIVIALSIY